jgi:hypothetical protein
MTRQRTFSRPPEAIAGAALVGLGLLVLLGNLDGAATALKLSCPLGATAGTAVQVLASVVLTTASQALQALLFDHQRFFQGLFQMLLSFWLLTFVIVGAALFKGCLHGQGRGISRTQQRLSKTDIRDLSIWPSSIRRVSRARI